MRFKKNPESRGSRAYQEADVMSPVEMCDPLAQTECTSGAHGPVSTHLAWKDGTTFSVGFDFAFRYTND